MSETPVIQRAESDGNFVWFETEAVENKAKSEQAGRPIFEDVIYITIQGPGKKDCPKFRMEGDYLKRYRKEFEAWKVAQTGGQKIEGTPLAALHFMSKAQAAEFRAMGVYTAEMLSAIDDNALQRFGPGARALRDQAKAFLEQAAGNAPIARLTAENNRQAETIRDLIERQKTMQEQINELSTKKGKAA